MSKSQQESLDHLTRDDRVDVYMKIVDPKTLKVLYDSGKNSFPSSVSVVRPFLRQHAKDLSSDYSGYSGDLSSETSIDGSNESTGNQRRTSQGSAISTIPAEKSFLTIPSSKGSIVPKKEEKRGGREGRDIEPLLTSTKLDDSIVKENVMSSRSGKSSLTNGDVLADHNVSEVAETGSLEQQSASKTPKVEESSNGPKARGRKRRKNSKNSSEQSEDKPSNVTGGKTQAKRLRKASDVFDSSSNEEPMTVDEISTESHSENNGDVKPEVKSGFQVQEPAVSGSRVLEEKEKSSLAKSATLWGCIGIGEWVFARWRDKNYYSGQITEKGLNDTWQIHFEDNMDDVASETHILPIKIIGLNVKAVYSPDNIFRPSLAKVIGQKFVEEPNRVEYAIECADGDSTVLMCQRKQLSLKESEAKELRKSYQASIPKAADVSLDNILAGPRRRGVGTTPQPGGRKVVGGAFDTSSADDSLLRDSAGTPTPKKPLAHKLATATKSSSSSTGVTDVDSNLEGTNAVATPSNSSTVAVGVAPKTPGTGNVLQNKETPKGAPKESAKKTAKSKEKDKALFKGLQFFLTASGGGDPSSSGSEAPSAVLPYDKDEYKESIESKGGKVVESVGREKGKEDVYLISDSHARTVKYIYCLAAGIPCVSHTWLGECLKKNTIVDWKPYELKSGWSLEDERVIAAHQKKPLKNLKIYVTAETDELYNYWKPVLTAAEATLLKPRNKSGSAGSVPNDTEVVVTDSSCSMEIYERVNASNIPMVKPEWLVQSIITGKKASYTGHERYKITPGNEFVEDDE